MGNERSRVGIAGSRRRRRAWVVGLAVSTLAGAGACGKKEAPSGRGGAAAPSLSAMSSATPGPTAPARRVSGADGPASARGAVTTVTVQDPGLKKLLDETLGQRAKGDLDAARKELADAKRAFDVSAAGKQIYAQLQQTISTLGAMAEEARQGRFETVSGLAASGYFSVMVAIYQLKDLAKAIARKAVTLARRLQLSKAKDLAKDGKALVAAQSAIRKVLARYTDVVTALAKSKSPRVRLATARSLAKVYAKAPAPAKAWIRALLRAAAAQEKDAAAKKAMQQVLAGLT